jgi:tetratricopeptide (TPR) repeat protein
LNRAADDSRRNLVPQWLSARDKEAVRASLPGKHIDQARLDKTKVDRELLKIHAAWEAHRGLGYATELTSAAATHNRPEIAQEAARLILERSEQATNSAVYLARKVLGDEPGETPELDVSSMATRTEREAIEAIREGRRLLRLLPENPAVYVEVSRGHAVLGQNVKAERAMDYALRLAPEHRRVLRAASRLYQLHNDPLRSLLLLRRRSVTRHDPWLIAAELAMSKAAGKDPRFARVGRDLLSSRRFHPFHTSELAAALASLELEHGQRRRARQLFRSALEEPTRNTVAQAAWAERRERPITVFDDELVDKFNVAEARFFAYEHSRDWTDALRAAWDWLHNEPFSTRPVLFGTNVAAVAVGRYDIAEELLKIGLRADSDDRRLLCQAIYVYGSAGKIKEAERYLERVRRLSLSSEERVVLTANEGLLLYRKGFVSEARAKYLAAVSAASNMRNNPAFVLNALAHFAREEKRFNGSLLPELLASVNKLKAVDKHPALDAFVEDLLK